jgi:hypothetical protein
MVPRRWLPAFLRHEDEAELSTDLERIRHLPEGPAKMARFALWWLRKTVFTKAKPDNPAFFVTLSESELLEVFGGAYFEPNWELSYSYRNETLNLRRVEYVSDHTDYPEYRWWQVHIRGYEHDSTVGEVSTFELAAHYELEPTEYPRGHVEHVGLEIRRGAIAVRDVLDAHDVDYEYRYADGRPANVESEPLADESGDSSI